MNVCVCRSLRTGDHNVTFDEFIQYIVHEGLNGGMDIHWSPQYDVCQPCYVNYDFIGHYETLHRDANHVLRQIAVRSNQHLNTSVHFPATDRDSPNRTSYEFVRQFYDNVSPYYVRRLLELYKKDYETFDYELPSEILSTT